MPGRWPPRSPRAGLRAGAPAMLGAPTAPFGPTALQLRGGLWSDGGRIRLARKESRRASARVPLSTFVHNHVTVVMRSWRPCACVCVYVLVLAPCGARRVVVPSVSRECAGPGCDVRCVISRIEHRVGLLRRVGDTCHGCSSYIVVRGDQDTCPPVEPQLDDCGRDSSRAPHEAELAAATHPASRSAEEALSSRRRAQAPEPPVDSFARLCRCPPSCSANSARLQARHAGSLLWPLNRAAALRERTLLMWHGLVWNGRRAPGQKRVAPALP